MNDAEHQELRVAIGPYVLGHLGAAEAAAVGTHLDTCAECRAEHDQLVPVAGALRGASLPAAGGTAVPPPELSRRIEDRIISSHRRHTRARAVRATLTAVLAAAAAAVVVVAGVRVTRPDPAPTVPLEAVAVTEQAPDVVASANVVDHTWGVELKLEVTGLEAGAVYDATVLGLDGRSYPAGAFVGTGDQPTRCNLNAGVLRDQASGFEVRDADGQVVLTSTFG